MIRARIRVAAVLTTIAVAHLGVARIVVAQSSAGARDTLYLDDLQRAAERTDKRASQLSLLTEQSARRIASIESERRPSLNATGVAQYLSDVPSVGAMFPSGGGVPSPAKDQYDVYLAVRQPLVDPSRHARIAVEQAQVAESAARVRSTLWQQRAQVNEAFFGVVLRDTQRQSLEASIADLASRRAATAKRVDAGTALQSEVLLLDAELARRTQSRDELLVEQEAAREVLSLLAGQRIPATAVLVVRDVQALSLPSPVAADTSRMPRARPEYAQFDRARDLLSARQLAASSQDLPRVSLFGRTGYGRPGLNALGRAFDTYASAGVQVDWTLWNWGRTKRDIEVQQLQAQLVSTDEAAFTESIRRAATADLGRIAAIERSLALDDSIIALRERVLRETRLRHDEGDVTSADYVARQTELLSAQLDRDTRRVRLHEARVRYLNTLGREARP